MEEEDEEEQEKEDEKTPGEGEVLPEGIRPHTTKTAGPTLLVPAFEDASRYCRLSTSTAVAEA